MSVSFERFPVELEVTRVVISTSNPEMQVYLITGVMNANQLETLDKRIPITSKFEVGEDKWAIAALTNHKKLCEVYASFTDSAKSWRGAYYVLTNVFVEKCRGYCK
jgi:hypothetical protein